MRHLISISLSCLFLLYGCSDNKEETELPQDYESEFPTESFIRSHLLTEKGLIQTNVTNRENEFLSESLGLYLLFLVERDRADEFASQVDVLTEHFLHASNLVSWRLERTNDGLTRSPANAWIDDARIVHALYEAGDAFDEPSYIKLAEQIGTSLTSIGVKDGIPVDFVDLATKERGDVLTLSYLDEDALRHMAVNDLYDNSKQVLSNAPLSDPFFAKSYVISTQTYQFDEEINMIDQLYVALRYEQFGLSTASFYSFFKETFNDGIVYGRYDLNSKKPTVNYESQAVYALAIFYLLERDERDFAERVMNRLTSSMVSDSSSDYYGGYLDVDTKETHAFDNLLPLLAEGGLIDGYLIP
ncbi:hypothetical protein [Exiguobacterium sp. ERU653]|uniref:hypothetical protein n=1 Tax=Exiguobacterium sp. ERU653 TaxID=2751254 RepID=UPI001BE5E44F|nr:hypothetical protein [Exiguobacterium sp. ERU653]